MVRKRTKIAKSGAKMSEKEAIFQTGNQNGTCIDSALIIICELDNKEFR